MSGIENPDRHAMLRNNTFYSAVRGRKFAASLSVLLHAIAIAVLLMHYQQSSARRSTGLSVVALSSVTMTPSPPHPARRKARPVVPRIAVAPVPPIPDSPPTLVQAAAQFQPAADDCDLTYAVQTALRDNAQVTGQLPNIPIDQRSVANAIALWNRTWLQNDNAPSQLAIAPIRDTVMRVVQSSTDACRNQVQAGPRLIYLPDAQGQSTVLALGSGKWTWQQVAQTARSQLEPTGNIVTTPDILDPKPTSIGSADALSKIVAATPRLAQRQTKTEKI